MSGRRRLFQSTRPQGARPVGRRRQTPPARRFNPRARKGRDLCLRSVCLRCPCFNPRARKGRDGAFTTRSAPIARFNPRARKGRDPRCRTGHPRTAGFNPRARKGRDVMDFLPHWDQPVSIHAPARGATELLLGLLRQLHVSIHAPARGATNEGYLDDLREAGFNPRARKGRDVVAILGGQDPKVSIHAPARGATGCGIWKSSGSRLFQSTRPQGARHSSFSRRYLCCAGFNPRARKGRDVTFFATGAVLLWFQSTRPQGARLFA